MIYFSHLLASYWLVTTVLFYRQLSASRKEVTKGMAIKAAPLEEGDFRSVAHSETPLRSTDPFIFLFFLIFPKFAI